MGGASWTGPHFSPVTSIYGQKREVREQSTCLSFYTSIGRGQRRWSPPNVSFQSLKRGSWTDVLCLSAEIRSVSRERRPEVTTQTRVIASADNSREGESDLCLLLDSFMCNKTKKSNWWLREMLSKRRFPTLNGAETKRHLWKSLIIWFFSPWWTKWSTLLQKQHVMAFTTHTARVSAEVAPLLPATT